MAMQVIGLHPDEATEAIVDCALAHNKPFAVVPCCVFPRCASLSDAVRRKQKGPLQSC